MTARVAVGVSEELDTVAAASEAADRAARGLDARCDLCLLFASAPHLPLAKWLLSEVHDRLEPRHLIGCGAGGTLGDGREIEEGPGLSVWAASLPGAEIATHHMTAERQAGGFAIEGGPEAPGEALLLLSDPYSFPAEALLDELDESSPGTPVIGGLASASFAGGAALLRNGEVHAEGAVACTLSGAGVIPCVSQGAAPVGPEMAVTAVRGNVIEELAGQPAMERLGEVIAGLGERERDLARHGLLLGVVIDENRPDHGRGDFLVRPIVGADPDSGAIVIGQQVRVGQTVRVHVRDAASADEDLREALRLQSEALGADGAAGALLFTCNGRGSHMFEVSDHDAATLADALAVPAAGFFCAGEIGPIGGRNFLHGFTATMAVFPTSG